MTDANTKSGNALNILRASILMDFVGTGLLIPLLPFYAQAFNASAVEVGVLMGLYPLMGIVAPALWGSLSDRIGRRPALLFNIAGTTLAFLWFGVATSLWMLFIARILSGASSASIVIAQSYISDLTTPENRTKALSTLEASAMSGFLVGPILAGVLIGPDPANPNFHAPGLAAAIASAITFSLAFWGLPRAKQKPAPSISQPRPSLQQVLLTVSTTLKRPLIRPAMAIVFITVVASMGIESVFALWCEAQFGWGAQQFGYFLIFYAVMTVVIQLGLTGRLTQRFDEVKLLLVGLIIGVIGLVGMGYSTTVFQLLGTTVLVTFSMATSTPILTSLLTHLAGAKQQGQTLGLLQSVNGLGRFLGAIAAGFVFGTLGPLGPFWVGAGLMLCAIAVCGLKLSQSRLLSVMRDRRRQKLAHLFDLLDHDKNGTLELSDFQQAGHTFAELKGWGPSDEAYDILQTSFIGFGQMLEQLADRDGNQKIDRKEWLLCLDKKVDDDFANFFLQIIDVNQDGAVTLEELKVFYQTYGIQTSDLEEAFHTMDLNQDGHLSKDEFETLFSQFLYGDDIQAPGNWIFGTTLPQKL